MFTLHHGFWLYFFSRRHPRVWQFVFGSMLPDYVYFVLVAVLLVQGRIFWRELFLLSPLTFMGYLPQYPWAVQLDLIGHSAVFWLLAFLLALLPVICRVQAFIVGWGTHLLLDGLTHAAQANFFLYPLSLAVVHSPVSFWEPEYFAREFKQVNGTLMGMVTIYLIYCWWKKRQKGNNNNDY